MIYHLAETPEAIVKRDRREMAGWWVILDAKGNVKQAVRTRGCHPSLERGEAFNVMRTFAVDGRPDITKQRFDKTLMRMVDDNAKSEQKMAEARAADLISMTRPDLIDQIIMPMVRSIVAEELARRGIN